MEFCIKQLRTLYSFQNCKIKLKNQNLQQLMFLHRLIQWYNPHADLIWPDFTFNAIALPESYNSSNYGTYSSTYEQYLLVL